MPLRVRNQTKVISFVWIMKGMLAVAITQKAEKRKAYIGHAEFETIEQSALQVVQWGQSFNLQAAEILIKESGIITDIVVLPIKLES